MKKHYFLLWTKEAAFFPHFYHGVIFYSAELFEFAVNFKFYLNIFIFLNKNTNQRSDIWIKKQLFILRSAVKIGFVSKV